MFNILICDDELSVCTHLEKIFADYALNNKLEIMTEIFLTGQTLLDFLKENPSMDLLFLDIVLPDINGAEIGKKIREELENETVQIVFISAQSQYAMQLFPSRPFDFLIKPLERDMIISLFEKYRQLYEKKKLFFEYRVGKRMEKVLLSEIMYFMCEKRKICIATTREKIYFYGNIKKIHRELNADGFWSVHVSFIINVRYVKIFRNNEIVMCNDYIVPVSQTYKKDVRRKIMELNEVC